MHTVSSLIDMITKGDIFNTKHLYENMYEMGEEIAETITALLGL